MLKMVKIWRKWSQTGVVDAWQPKVSSPMRARYPPSPRRAFFWRPGVRPTPPVSTKRELAGQSSPAAPQLCQQSAKERAQCPGKFASHSQRSFTSLYQRQLRRALSALSRGGSGSDGNQRPALLVISPVYLVYFYRPHPGDRYHEPHKGCLGFVVWKSAILC
jgi:hypothetical protein